MTGGRTRQLLDGGVGVIRAIWRADGRHRLAGWIVVAVIVAAGTGAGVSAVAAARRTASAYPRFLDASRAPDVVIDLGFAPTPSVSERIDELPGVVDRADAAALAAARFRDGVPDLNYPNNLLSSVDGRRFYEIDAVSVLHGRMPEIQAADEVLANETFASEEGLEVGDVLHLGIATAEAIAGGDPASGSLDHQPLTLEVVGIGVLPEQVVQDDVAGQRLLIGGPALFRRYQESELFQRVAIDLAPGTDVNAFKSAVQGALGDVEDGAQFEDRARITERTQRAVRPHALALGVVGGFALAATALVAGQSLARSVAEGEHVASTLRSLGASRWSVGAGLTAPGIASVGAGVAVGAAVAVGLSPLGPVGAVRPVEPAPGFDLDLTAVGLGAAAVMTLTLVRTGLAARSTVLRAISGSAARRRPSWLADRLARAGAPPAATVGARQAVGTGRRAISARLVLATTVAALAVVIAVVGFDAGLDHLLRTPRLYGNAWDATVIAEGGYGSLDLDRLSDDADVRELSAALFGTLVVDDIEVPGMAVVPVRGEVVPPIIEGSAPGDGEIVLGRDTLDALGRSLGDRVEVILPDEEAATPMTVVGTAVFPAIGLSDNERPGLARGALLRLPREAVDEGFVSTALVRLDDGSGEAFARRHTDETGDVSVYGDPRPADIAGFERLGALPTALALAFGLVALGAIAHGVIAGTRGHRHDDAVLSALGASPRQRRNVIRVHALVIVVLGAVVGAPLGLVVGRLGWQSVARDAGTVAELPVPILPSLAAACVLGLAAGVVGDLTARMLVRARPVAALRSE